MNHALYNNPAQEGLILLTKINTIKKKITWKKKTYFISAS